MERLPRRILVAIEPGVLQGALATLLRAGADDEVVQAGRAGRGVVAGAYDAAVVSDELPDEVSAEVTIVLPDTYGSGGTGTVMTGDQALEIGIWDAEQIVELLDRYAPRNRVPPAAGPPVRRAGRGDGAAKEGSSSEQ